MCAGKTNVCELIIQKKKNVYATDDDGDAKLWNEFLKTSYFRRMFSTNSNGTVLVRYKTVSNFVTANCL